MSYLCSECNGICRQPFGDCEHCGRPPSRPASRMRATDGAALYRCLRCGESSSSPTGPCISCGGEPLRPAVQAETPDSGQHAAPEAVRSPEAAATEGGGIRRKSILAALALTAFGILVGSLVSSLFDMPSPVSQAPAVAPKAASAAPVAVTPPPEPNPAPPAKTPIVPIPQPTPKKAIPPWHYPAPSIDSLVALAETEKATEEREFARRCLSIFLGKEWDQNIRDLSPASQQFKQFFDYMAKAADAGITLPEDVVAAAVKRAGEPGSPIQEDRIKRIGQGRRVYATVINKWGYPEHLFMVPGARVRVIPLRVAGTLEDQADSVPPAPTLSQVANNSPPAAPWRAVDSARRSFLDNRRLQELYGEYSALTGLTDRALNGGIRVPHDALNAVIDSEIAILKDIAAILGVELSENVVFVADADKVPSGRGGAAISLSPDMLCIGTEGDPASFRMVGMRDLHSLAESIPLETPPALQIGDMAIYIITAKDTPWTSAAVTGPSLRDVIDSVEITEISREDVEHPRFLEKFPPSLRQAIRVYPEMAHSMFRQYMLKVRRRNPAIRSLNIPKGSVLLGGGQDRIAAQTVTLFASALTGGRLTAGIARNEGVFRFPQLMPTAYAGEGVQQFDDDIDFLPAFCIEEGRFETGKENVRFTLDESVTVPMGMLVGSASFSDMRRFDKQQEAYWDLNEMYSTAFGMRETNPTKSLSVAMRHMDKLIAEEKAPLPPLPDDAVGMVSFVNGEVIGIWLSSRKGEFPRQWPRIYAALRLDRQFSKRENDGAAQGNAREALRAFIREMGFAASFVASGGDLEVSAFNPGEIHNPGKRFGQTESIAD